MLALSAYVVPKLSLTVNVLVLEEPEFPAVITTIISSFACAVIDEVVMGVLPELDSEPYPMQLLSIPIAGATLTVKVLLCPDAPLPDVDM